MGAFICAICDGMFCHHEVICEEYKGTQLVCQDCSIKLFEDCIHPKCGGKMNSFSGNENMPAGQYCPKCNDGIYDEQGNLLCEVN